MYSIQIQFHIECMRPHCPRSDAVFLKFEFIQNSDQTYCTHILNSDSNLQ